MTQQIHLLKHLHVDDWDQDALWTQLKENCSLQTKLSFSEAGKWEGKAWFISWDSRSYAYTGHCWEVSRHQKEIQGAQENLCIL